MLETKELTKRYGDLTALNSISVKFKSGQVVGLVGPNGSGKSTFLSCIAGTINYKGQIISNLLNQYKRNLFYFPSELFFYPKMKGKEYLQYCLQSNDLNENSFSDLNHFFKLPLDQFAETYSMGMKKKLVFFSMFLLKKKILLLDEPFSSIDMESTRFLLDSMKTIKKENPTNLTIIASHNLTHLKELCTDYTYIDEGRIQTRKE
ncbi:MAG: ATP-binding cassette domain-containing protein [Cyclobacteriaceae bacterium]|nr:ATP-binding cassette domain-containing protein [Cyclobacteriaceae bacterium]